MSIRSRGCSSCAGDMEPTDHNRRAFDDALATAASDKAVSHGWALAADLERIRSGMGLAVPDPMMARGALVWTSLFGAISFDRSGTTRIGRFVLNHSFMIPGLVATTGSVAVGLLIARFF